MSNNQLKEQYERVQCQRMDAMMLSETYEEFLERRIKEQNRYFKELANAAAEYIAISKTQSGKAYRNLITVLENFGII